MKATSQRWQNPKRMPVSSKALRDDCFAAGGVAAAKAKIHQRGVDWQRLRRWSRVALAGVKEAEKSEQLPKDFSTLKVNVRIHYRKMRFIGGFTLILTAQFCASAAQGG